MKWAWQNVSGKGTIYSYEIIVRSVMPGFRDWVPYPIVLVGLDEQSGQPTPGDGLRLTTNLIDDMNAEQEEKAAIGKRVEAVFMDVGDGLTLPQFKLSNEASLGEVWQYPA